MFLGVTGTLWNVNEEELARLAGHIRLERINRGWSKEEAAREAKISSITWKRVEDGLPVQDRKLAAVERALGWTAGSASYVARGKEPAIERPGAPHAKDRRLFFRDDGSHDTQLSEAFQGITHFADVVKVRGAEERLISYLYDDAFALIDSVARDQERRGIDLSNARHIYDLAAREGEIQASTSLGHQSSAGEENQSDD